MTPEEPKGPLAEDAAPLGVEALDDVVEVLGDAFEDYPVMRFVLGDTQDYARDLPLLVRFFTLARVLRREPVLGVSSKGRLVGVALVSFPESHFYPQSLAEARHQTWDALGREAEARYAAFGAVTSPFFEGLVRTHLNMIGVRREAQGRGVGGKLLEAVAALASERRASRGISLTTERRSNVDLYRRFGYEVVGHQQVAPELETWGMFKEIRRE